MQDYIRFFEGVTIVAELKKLYHHLAMQNHPDRGGKLETMQEINRQYQAALKRADGQTSLDEQEVEHTYKYDEAIEAAIVAFIDRLIKTGILDQGCAAWIIGTWVWIETPDRSFAPALGPAGLGALWHRKRGLWYFNPHEGRHFASSKSISGLAAQYGAERVDAKGKEAKPKSAGRRALN
jgi:hypothetical protein